MKLYGNSLSQAIRKMAEENISTAEVIAIISGTAFTSKEQMLNTYKGETSLWTEEQFAIAERLWDEGKILQPRIILEEEESPFNPWKFGRKALITFGKEVFYRNVNDLCDIEIDKEATAHNQWIINRLREKCLL